MPIRYQFVLDDEFFLASVERAGRRYQRKQRIELAVYALGLAVLILLTSPTLSQALVLLVGAAVLVGGIMALLSPVARLLARLNARQSPSYGLETKVELSEEGLRVENAGNTIDHAWSAMTQATRHPDGLALWLGIEEFQWLPHEALVDGCLSQDAERLVQDRVAEYQVA